MAKFKLFPTLLHRTRLSSLIARKWIPSLIRDAQLFRELDTAGEKWSGEHYYAGYTSYSSITDLAFRSSSFGELKEWIDREVRKFSRDLELDLGSGRLEMSAFWINIMGAGSHHAFHLHPLSTVSGTFYLQIPKGSGSFKIEDPRLPGFMGSPPRKQNARPDNQRFYDLKPEVGELVLFESWLKHEVTANLGKSERMSVSFNYDWVTGIRLDAKRRRR